MRRVTLSILLFLVSAFAWAGATWQLTIAHTNDLHGWVMPFDYQPTNVRFAASEFVDGRYTGANVGGLARRSTLITQMRKQATHPFVLIDAGDLFTRGPWHRTFFGAREVAAYNQMGYDMACVGNNEFKATGDVGAEYILRGLVRMSRFPWITANLTGEDGQPVETVRPYIVRKYGDVRVGFLGLTAPRSKDYPQTRGWTIIDPVAAARHWVPIARKQCDVLIAVTHIGVDLDKQLAAQVAGIDAIVGGDSHTFLPEPVVVKNPDGVAVPIVQAGAYGVCVGRLDLTFEKQGAWRLSKYAGKLIRVNASTTEDPAIKGLLGQWLDTPAPVMKAAGLMRVSRVNAPPRLRLKALPRRVASRRIR